MARLERCPTSRSPKQPPSALQSGPPDAKRHLRIANDLPDSLARGESFSISRHQTNDSLPLGSIFAQCCESAN